MLLIIITEIRILTARQWIKVYNNPLFQNRDNWQELPQKWMSKTLLLQGLSAHYTLCTDYVHLWLWLRSRSWQALKSCTMNISHDVVQKCRILIRIHYYILSNIVRCYIWWFNNARFWWTLYFMNMKYFK